MMTLQRADQLKEYGENAARLALKKGKKRTEWAKFCPLMSAENIEAWKIGWSRVFDKN
jgi:hypothetical protein